MQDREDVTRVSHEVSKTGLSSSEMSETVKGIFLPEGRSVGDHCRMLTNKSKGCTAEYTIIGYDG